MVMRNGDRIPLEEIHWNMDWQPGSDMDAFDLIVRALRRERMVKRPLTVRPISYPEAADYVDAVHRHHSRPQGWKYGVALEDVVSTVGVAMVGRPVSRNLDDGNTVELIRLAVMPFKYGGDNAATMLLGAVARIAKDLGFERIITYTLEEEDGGSLRAAGWTDEGSAGGGSWDRRQRPRDESLEEGPKRRWSRQLKPMSTTAGGKS